ncbi:DUF202 domain-containing protein [Streptomyces sp. NPDC050658]|uniref:DUF202 domain-containing protein n=1 Tax=unclassified Streptomyces TaxID=2593676 RepID=UPI003439443E
MGDSPGTRDPGLQPERTRLAWRRTTLSCTVVTALGIKPAVQGNGTPAAVGVTGLALSALVWIGFLAVSHRRIRTLDAPRPRSLSVRATLLAAGCVMTLAACGATLVW